MSFLALMRYVQETKKEYPHSDKSLEYKEYKEYKQKMYQKMKERMDRMYSFFTRR